MCQTRLSVSKEAEREAQDVGGLHKNSREHMPPLSRLIREFITIIVDPLS